MVDTRRVLNLNNLSSINKKGPVVYWMSRDQRVFDNWALIYSLEISKKYDKHTEVVFFLNTNFLDATIRQYDFMLKGLMDVEEVLNEKNIPFKIIVGNPEKELVDYVNSRDISCLVTDFSPLKIGRKWREYIAKKIDIPMFEVDAHNIVPCFYASNKQEFGAYTIRPKLNKLKNEFLTEYPNIKTQEIKIESHKVNWKKLFDSLQVNQKVLPIDWIQPGYKNGMKVFKNFIEDKIKIYNDLRNDPNIDASSNLSPYLHFGHISSQRVVLDTLKHVNEETGKSFIEEIFVRKELADNFCFYNQNYDSPKGFPEWAKKSHLEHQKDKKEYIYSLKELENHQTHDPLWNAAQFQMVSTGKMHGYLRMYWAKKIFEWTKDTDEAMKFSIYLNDKYELDGRDPNGYTGIAWSIGGVHDRAWFTRPIFGKIRYMSFNGAKTKFDVEKYIKRYLP